MEPPAFRRHLSHRQLAFVRAWAEGLDLADAWSRYIADDTSAPGRRPRDDLRRLLDELGSRARGFGRADVAALLRRDPDAIVAAGPPAPTLEEFRADQPADFYSEAELLELYQASHGRQDARSPARRRQRLRERQVQALQWLDGQVARDPQANDPIAAWLDDGLAKRLARVGMVRLQALLDWIRDQGPRWYQPVPQLGPQRAARITAWLVAHAGSLGPPPWLGRPLVDATPAVPQPGLLPLERFCAPPGLDGATGGYRAPAMPGLLAASTDVDAVRAWLRLREEGSHTWRAYRREAERCLLWAVLQRHTALSSLTAEDCEAYRNFLAHPPSAWTAARKTSRASIHWRPFEGPLSPRSVTTAVAILRGMCQWLVQQQYLVRNPWNDLPATTSAPLAPTPPLRALSRAHWAAVQAWLVDPAARLGSAAGLRLGFVVGFAQATGLRLSELVAARIGWLQEQPGTTGAPAWALCVPDAHQGRRSVPLPTSTVAALQRYLVSRGLPADLHSNAATTPIIAQVRRNAALSPARLYEVLVEGFSRCAAHVALSDPVAAAHIGRATTHWLRHTHGTHAIADGVSRQTLRMRLGHQSPSSTAIYVDTARTSRPPGR